MALAGNGVMPHTTLSTTLHNESHTLSAHITPHLLVQREFHASTMSAEENHVVVKLIRGDDKVRIQSAGPIVSLFGPLTLCMGCSQRRIRVRINMSLPELRETVATTLGVAATAKLTYTDCEGDRVMLATENDMIEAIKQLPPATSLRVHVNIAPGLPSADHASARAAGAAPPASDQAKAASARYAQAIAQKSAAIGDSRATDVDIKRLVCDEATLEYEGAVIRQQLDRVQASESGLRAALARLPLPTTAQLTGLSTFPTPPQVVVAAVQVVAAVLAGCNPCRGRGSGTTDAQSTPQEWKELQRGFLAHPEMVMTCLKRVVAQRDTIPDGRWESAHRMDNDSVTVASVRQGNEAAGLMLAIVRAMAVHKDASAAVVLLRTAESRSRSRLAAIREQLVGLRSRLSLQQGHVRDLELMVADLRTECDAAAVARIRGFVPQAGLSGVQGVAAAVAAAESAAIVIASALDPSSARSTQATGTPSTKRVRATNATTGVKPARQQRSTRVVGNPTQGQQGRQRVPLRQRVMAMRAKQANGRPTAAVGGRRCSGRGSGGGQHQYRCQTPFTHNAVEVPVQQDGQSHSTAMMSVEAGATFTKVWRLKNCGTSAWLECRMCPYNTRATHQDHALGGPASGVEVAPTAPNEDVEVRVTFTAPTRLGRATATWSLISPTFEPFGQRVTAQVMVVAPQRIATSWGALSLGAGCGATDAPVQESDATSTTASRGSVAELEDIAAVATPDPDTAATALPTVAVATLVGMGFPANMACNALACADNDVASAVDMLLSAPPTL